MPVIDVETLLKPVSEELPCGPDQRYERAYLDVLRISEGEPEVEMAKPGGEKFIVPAKEPNWREVQDGCIAVFAKSKDLRIAMLLTLASLRTSGYPGLRDGLALVHGLVTQWWDKFYPALDPEDNNDPTERMNIIAGLAVPPGTFSDPSRFQDRTRQAPIVSSRQLGPLSLADLMIVSGDLPAPTGEGVRVVDSNLVESIFEEVETEPLEQTAKLIEECAALVGSIEDALTEKVGAGKAIDLSSYKAILTEAAKQTRKRLAKRGIGPSDGGEGSAVSAGGGSGAAGARLAGEILSSADVLLAIDKVVRYYAVAEPSSPVPLLMVCAKQVVGKSFQEIYRVLPPEAVALLERISNPEEPAAS